MSDLPTGTVTFLFTDIEGSTKRWEQHPQAMKAALRQHDASLRAAIEANNGYVFKTVGDAFCAAFPTVVDALSAALDAQHALAQEDWGRFGDIGSIRARMALHTGTAEEWDGDYFGPPVNRVARLLSAGHGGQILLSLATCDLLSDQLPPGIELLDFGERRLKDLIRPEHVFQVVVPDLPSDFPPIKTLDARPNNLPVQATPLVGRERELAGVLKLLADEQIHLVTLTGPGGVGKTRLGLQVAADVIDEFEDGVIFVALAPIIEAELVVSTIAQAMGVKEAAGQPPIDTLKDYLRDKQLLLVLDNFEQLVEAAPSVSELLAAVPRLKVLATGRERLHLRGEHEFPVPPLALPDREHPPPIEQLGQYEAVQLFVERAVAAKPDFVVTNDNLVLVAEICQRLDGLPLAIELAAARIKVLSPRAMLVRLGSTLKVLIGGARDLPARQQTLRNTLEWSYELLEEGEKQLFRRMSVFQGGRRLEALEAVCNYDGQLRVEVLEGVESLVNKSLLQQRDGGRGRGERGEGSDAEPRLWMLETIQEYAREKLVESGEGEALGREHALYFMRLAEEAEPHLKGAAQGEWLDRLEEEHDNIRAALRMARESQDPEDAQFGLLMAGALSQFWYVRGYATEGREQLAAALASLRAGPVPDPRSVATQQSLRAKALTGGADLAWMQGDYEAATEMLREGLRIYRQLGDRPGVAQALNELGNVAYDRGDYEGARPLYEESLTLFRELGDKRGISNLLSNLGLAAYGLREYDLARNLHKESLALRRELANKWGIATSLNNLGIMASELGDYATAQPLFEESLALYKELEGRWGIAVVLNNLGNVAHDLEDYAGARSLHEASLEIMREYGGKWGIAEGLEGLARALSHDPAAPGMLERAARLWGAAEVLREGAGTPLSAADRGRHERTVGQARGLINEAAFEAAWKEGRETPLEQIIDKVLEEAASDLP